MIQCKVSHKINTYICTYNAVPPRSMQLRVKSRQEADRWKLIDISVDIEEQQTTYEEVLWPT